MIALQQVYHMARSGMEQVLLSDEQIQDLMNRPMYCFNEILCECGQTEAYTDGELNHEEFVSMVQNDGSYIGCMITGAPDSEININQDPEDYNVIDYHPLELNDLTLNYEEYKGSIDNYRIDTPLQMGDLCKSFLIYPQSNNHIECRTYDDIIKQREELDDFMLNKKGDMM
jgi:hypothetical protein